MNWKRGLGFGFIVIGLYIAITARVFTGAVVGFTPQNYISLLGVGIFIAGVVLILGTGLEKKVSGEKVGRELSEEERAVHEPARSIFNYELLKKRLREIEAQKLPGSRPGIPEGRCLTRSEEWKIYDVIWKYLPDDLKRSKDLEISITGSLSIAGEGRRKPGKYGISNQLPSDMTYLSDVDIQIAGKPIFDYIEAKWGSAVIRGGGKGRGGVLKNVATYKVTDEKYLNRRERETGYMAEAPAWIKKIVDELGRIKFVGEERPVNIKFFKDRGLLKGKSRDILYESSTKKAQEAA